jgi:hypothetical protein
VTYQDILDYFGNGSLTPAARALGLPVTTVNKWRDGVPYGRQCEIQLRTAGKLVADPPQRNGAEQGA